MDIKLPAQRNGPHAGMRLSSRSRVSIRPIDTSDASGLSDFYRSLSPESIRRRFLGTRKDPGSEVARTCRWDRGLVAELCEPGPRDGAIVGHVGIYPVEKGRAEVAFAVADELQGHGIGTALMREAVRRAASIGVVRLEAATFADNTAMRRMLLHVGRPVLSDAIESGVEEIAIGVSSAGAPYARVPSLRPRRAHASVRRQGRSGSRPAPTPCRSGH